MIKYPQSRTNQKRKKGEHRTVKQIKIQKNLGYINNNNCIKYTYKDSIWWLRLSDFIENKHKHDCILFQEANLKIKKIKTLKLKEIHGAIL